MTTAAAPAYAIVLGAAVWPGGAPSPALRRRAERAAELWHSGKVAGLVASGGVGRNPPSEAAVIRNVVIGLGVPDSAVVLEEHSHNTLENIQFSKELLPPEATAVIVSDGWHLPRARRIAAQAGLTATTAAARAPNRRRLRQIRAVLREAVALIWHMLRHRR